MKKKLVPILIGLLVVAALALGSRVLRADAEAPKTEKPADVTLSGTVVDMHCYVTRGASDAGHAGCANACISRGVPAGFLTDDGVLYVLLGQTPHSVKETVKDMAGVPAKATGAPIDRGGVKGLQLKSIEKTGDSATR